MTKKLTIRQVRRYVEIDGGLSCPYCDSSRIEAKQTRSETGRVYQEVSCLACLSTWVNGYTLDSVGSGNTGDFEFIYPSHADACAARAKILEPPPKEDGKEPVFRVACLVDVNALDRIDAAQKTHEQMSSTLFQPSLLYVIDHDGRIQPVQLADSWIAHHSSGIASENAAPTCRPDTIHPAVRQIHDLLYLEMEGDKESWDPEKEWNADTLAEIAEVIARYMPRPPTTESDGR